LIGTVGSDVFGREKLQKYLYMVALVMQFAASLVQLI
jgi:hypothetical protein